MGGMKTTGWRRVASAIWGQPNDAQIYGMFEQDASALLRFQDRAGEHVTLTHLVGKGIAHALHEVPELNVVLRRGREIPRPSVDIFFITTVGGGRDLSGSKVERADEKSAAEIAAELRERSEKLRGGKDRAFKRSKRLSELLPFPLLHPTLRLIAWASGDLQLDLPGLGLPARPFGSAMVSSVGMLGLPMGFSPLAWLYKVPLLLVVGKLEDKPVAVDGQVVIRPMVPICATIDHRYADGWHISKLLEHFRAYLEAPERFEPATAPPASAARTPSAAGGSSGYRDRPRSTRSARR